MHSSIEFAHKKRSVFCVSAWKTIFEIGRRKNPYRVHQQSFSDFVDCKALSDQLIKTRSRNDRGETVNWLKIKVLRFEEDSHQIQYKYCKLNDVTYVVKSPAWKTPKVIHVDKLRGEHLFPVVCMGRGTQKAVHC